MKTALGYRRRTLSCTMLISMCCLKFGQTYANGLRHKSPRPGDQWRPYEVFLKINGRVDLFPKNVLGAIVRDAFDSTARIVLPQNLMGRNFIDLTAQAHNTMRSSRREV